MVRLASLSAILFFLAAVPVLSVAAPEAQTCTQYCTNPSGYELPEGKACLCNPLKANSFTEIINNVMNFLFGVAIVFAPIMVVLAGFMFLTAGGNPAQLTRARGILLWTAVGFGVILLAKGLTTVLQKIIGI